MKLVRAFALSLVIAVWMIACDDDDPAGSTSDNTGNNGNSGGSGANGAGALGGAGGDGAVSGGGSGAVGGGGSGGDGGSGGGAAPFAPQCDYLVDPPQCTLLDDCCNCMGLAPGEQAPVCNINDCPITACGALGIVDAYCTMAQCVAGTSCSAADVTCGDPEPDCPPGQAATVTAAGCWGGCIAVEECAEVTNCDVCSEAGLACVHSDGAFVQQDHCVPIPDGCGATADCACMGAGVCTNDFGDCYDGAGDNDPALTCVCGVC